GSLRQAITDANAHIGLDTIAFSIPGSSVHTIIPLTDMPAISDPVIIDGYTQPGSSVNTLANADNAVLLIEINGNNADVQAGPTISSAAAGSTIRGLVINRVGRASGINLSSSNCVITGCFIGTDHTGTVALPNTEQGIRSDTGPGNRFGGTDVADRNIISGNLGNGLELSEDNDVVEGSFIGVDATGTKALGNGVNGVRIDFSGSGNLIGGTTAAARNILSANGNCGV